MTPQPPSGPAGLLGSLRDLPGLAHALLTDADGPDGRVLADIGTDEGGTAAAVLAWGRRAAAVATDRALALDDVIVTTDTAHHLLRAVGGPSAGWVYLRVHREGGNLALARRRLAALTTPQTPAANRPPAELPAGPSSTPASPAPARDSARDSAPSATPPLATRSSPWPDRVPPPIRPPAATPTSTSAGSATTAALAPAALPAPPDPPATPRPPASRPARSAATPWTSSRGRTPSFTREVPETTPELPWPRRSRGASALSAVPAPPTDRAMGEQPLPKDSAGVLGQRWRSDPETLRRVLAGLLRLGRTPRTALAGSPESTTTTRSPGAAPTRRNP